MTFIPQSPQMLYDYLYYCTFTRIPDAPVILSLKKSGGYARLLISIIFLFPFRKRITLYVCTYMTSACGASAAREKCHSHLIHQGQLMVIWKGLR